MTEPQRITLTVTGMRSHKLFGNKYYNDPRYIRIVKETIHYLHRHPEIDVVNNGLATGSDLLVALAVIKYNKLSERKIALNCFIPGKNQTEKYSPKEKELYSFAIKNADKVIQVTNLPCRADVLKRRNRAMIDSGTNRVLSFWDCKDYRSGTYMTINYARKRDISVYNINPKDVGNQGFIYISSKESPEVLLSSGEKVLTISRKSHIEEHLMNELLRDYGHDASIAL